MNSKSFNMLVAILLLSAKALMADIVGPPVAGYTGDPTRVVVLQGSANVSWTANLSSFQNFANQVYAMIGVSATSDPDIQWRNDGGYYLSNNGGVVCGSTSSWQDGAVIYKFTIGPGYITDTGGTVTAHCFFFGNPAVQGSQCWMGISPTFVAGQFGIANSPVWTKAQLTSPDSWVGDSDGVNPIWYRDFTLNIPSGVKEFYVSFNDNDQAVSPYYSPAMLGYDSLVVNAKLAESQPVCGVDIPHPIGDISGPLGVPDCRVDIYDLAAFMQQWLNCTQPGGIGCAQSSQETHVIPQGIVTVDGDMSDWSDAQWIQLDKNYYGTPTDINNAKFAVKWNKDTGKIYAAIKVQDNAIALEDFPSSWNTSDRVEIYSQGSAAGGTGFGSGNIYYDIAQQYVIGVGNTPGTTWSEWGSGDPIGTDTAFEYKAVRSGSELIYEVGVKQFDYYGGWSGNPTVNSTLFPGKVVRFDILVGSKRPGFYGMLSENLMLGKYDNANAFQEYTLLDTNNCGLWGYKPGDLNQDCKVNFADFAQLAHNWLYCSPIDWTCSH